MKQVWIASFLNLIEDSVETCQECFKRNQIELLIRELDSLKSHTDALLRLMKQSPPKEREDDLWND